MVRYGCSTPSHHISIPVNRMVEEQEGCTTSLQDTSVSIPMARTHAYGYIKLWGWGAQLGNEFFILGSNMSS